MNLTETANLIFEAQKAYPFNSKGNNDPKATTKLWHTALQDVDYTIGKYALREHISTSKFFPTPIEIKGYAEQIENACKHPIFDLFGVMVLNSDFNSSTVSRYVVREAFKTKQAL